MFMVNWKKPAKDMQMALLAERVQIGRNWAIWPTTSRITVGSAQDMAISAPPWKRPTRLERARL
jgi:histidinol-phosphate aminotransferase